MELKFCSTIWTSWNLCCFLILTVLFLSEVAAATAAAAAKQFSINEARTICTAKCLKLFKSQVTGPIAEKIAVNPTAINAECSGSGAIFASNDTWRGGRYSLLDQIAITDCQACTFACTHYLYGKYSNVTSCSAFCRSVQLDQGFVWEICLQACESLEIIRAGEVGLGAAPPIAPPSPKVLRVSSASSTHLQTGESGLATALLDWSTGYNVSTASPDADPVVFLVQISQDSAEDFSTSHANAAAWRSLAFTTQLKIQLNDLASDYRYRFRVAAVLPSGGLAYSAASDEFELSVIEEEGSGPVRQSSATTMVRRAVKRLRESSSALGRCSARGQERGQFCVDVLIQWRLAKRIERMYRLLNYEISWLEKSRVESATPMLVGRVLVPRTTFEYRIADLKPATTYIVQVTANLREEPLESSTNVVDQPEIKSESSITITTMEVPRSLMNKESNQLESSKHQKSNNKDLTKTEPSEYNCSCNAVAAKSAKLVPKQPYYENGQLKMLLLWSSSVFQSGSASSPEFVSTYAIRWSQRVCIEAENLQNETRETVVYNTPQFTISGLHFNCHYSIEFRGLTNSGRTAFTWTSCFCTGSCKETQIKGNMLPRCPRSEVAQVPQPPESLEVSTVASLVRLSWSAPAYPPMQAISGFRIRWGPREPEEVHPAAYSAGGLMPRISNSLALTAIVGPGERQYLLYELQPGRVYIVSVQTLTVFGDSRPRMRYFSTAASASGAATTSVRSFSSNAWRDESSLSGSEVLKNYITGGASSSLSFLRFGLIVALASLPVSLTSFAIYAV